MGPSISAEKLAENSRAMLFDCRSHLGNLAKSNKDFDARHIPRADHVDTRHSSRCRADIERIDPSTNHVPGAIYSPFFDNMTEGYFKPAAVLKQRFETLDLTPDSPLVRYCGLGVTAIHNVMALLVAGYPEPALYPGSWSEWITDPDRPIEIA